MDPLNNGSFLSLFFLLSAPLYSRLIEFASDMLMYLTAISESKMNTLIIDHCTKLYSNRLSILYRASLWCVWQHWVIFFEAHRWLNIDIFRYWRIAFIILVFKCANPSVFFVYLRSFQTNIITIYATNICEKCPSSIQCQDSNPRLHNMSLFP